MQRSFACFGRLLGDAVGVAHRSVRTYAVLHKNCEAVLMKNITVSVDEETHRLARIRAAELDTSVSALVRHYLRSLVSGTRRGPVSKLQGEETETERRRRMLREVIADIRTASSGFRAADNLSREELYDRAGARAEARAATAAGDENCQRG